MATPPDRDHRITLQQGVDYTRRYQADHRGGVKAWMFWATGGLTELMSQSQCAGLRIYLGMDEKNVVTPVLVAVDSEGNDLSAGTILEIANFCPPICPVASPLAGS